MYLSRAFVKTCALSVPKRRSAQTAEYKYQSRKLSSFLHHALDAHEATRNDNAPINEVKKRTHGQKNLQDAVEQLVATLLDARLRDSSGAARVASVGDCAFEKDLDTLFGAAYTDLMQEDSAWATEMPASAPPADSVTDSGSAPGIRSLVSNLIQEIANLIQSGLSHDAYCLVQHQAFSAQSLSDFLRDLSHVTDTKTAIQFCRRFVQHNHDSCSVDTLGTWLRQVALGEHELEDYEHLLLECERNPQFFAEFLVQNFRAKLRNDVWSRLVVAYCELENVKEVTRIFKFMESNEIRLNIRGTRSACVLFAKQDDMEVAEAFLAHLERENKVTPGVAERLIDMYSRLKTPKKAELMLKRMESSAELGIGPYNRLLLAYARAGRLEAAQELFRSLDSQLGFKPTKNSYEALSHAYAIAGDYHAALTVLEHMFMSLNAIPTRLNFGSVMNAAAEAGDVEFMETLFSRVDEFGINVNTHILQIKIKAYLKGNNPEAAVDTLRSMRDNADENLWPNARCYYTILDHFRTHNIPTTQIEEWMKEDQVEPEAPNLSSDIVHLLRKKETHRAMEKLQHTRASQPDWGPHAYVATLQHHGKRRDWVKGDQILKQLFDDGIRLTSGAYSVIIEYYCLKRAAADVERTLSEMIAHFESTGNPPNVPTVLTVLKAFTEIKQGDLLRQFWAALQSLPHYRPSLQEYSVMFHGLCSTKLFYDARKLVKRVVSLSLSLSLFLSRTQTKTKVASFEIYAAKKGNLVLDAQFCSAVAAELMCPAVASQRKILMFRAQKQKKFDKKVFNAQLLQDKEMQHVLDEHRGNPALRWIVFDPEKAKRQLDPQETAEFARDFKILGL